jgi:rubrerythrin
MVGLYVCKICGEPYLGGEAPDDCPFCGAPKNYIKSAEEFEELWKTELSEQEKSDMQETLDLEVNATAYYLDVTKANEKYSEPNRLFKQLARVEKEHAEIAVKFLGIELPEFTGETSKGSFEADLERTKELEAGAITKYQTFLQNATDIKVKNFYTALIHAEKGHQDIADKELE